MKVKSLLLGAAAGLVTVAASQAADLPTRKAAPVNYVRVCDAYGAGFFYIPGTDTCLRVGGSVLAQTRIQGSSQMYAMAPNAGLGQIIAGTTATAVGAVPTSVYYAGSAYRPAGLGLTRDQVGYDAIGAIELDARTQSPWGTVRSFVRIRSVFGSGVNATTGAYGALLPGGSGFVAGPAKDFTYLDKAFIQFAGITMGRVQSFFDFYTDNFNYESLRGSNQNVWALAYTAAFGGGMSATLSIEDNYSHRGPVASVLPQSNYTFPGFFNFGGAGIAAAQIPNVVANLRIDQPWGSAQIAGAINPVRAVAYAVPTGSGTPAGMPLIVANKIGWAVSGGLKFNLDMLSPGDQLWLQAIYAQGAIGYVSGANMAFVGSPNLTPAYGIGVARTSNAYGWGNATDADCVLTLAGTCELSKALAVTAALKHYWSPTLSSALFGSYYAVNYSQNALTPVTMTGGAGGATPMALGGISNYKEVRIGTNLVWSPVKNFDIGGEIAWIRGITSRPFGLPNDYTLAATGLPTFHGVNDSFYGKIRMVRAF
ncbi:MAG: porin [Hyphomicrobiales bacterium]|nr:porin [Hyphomicrobiales bacterium]